MELHGCTGDWRKGRLRWRLKPREPIRAQQRTPLSLPSRPQHDGQGTHRHRHPCPRSSQALSTGIHHPYQAKPLSFLLPFPHPSAFFRLASSIWWVIWWLFILHHWEDWTNPQQFWEFTFIEYPEETGYLSIAQGMSPRRVVAEHGAWVYKHMCSYALWIWQEKAKLCPWIMNLRRNWFFSHSKCLQPDSQEKLKRFKAISVLLPFSFPC